MTIDLNEQFPNLPRAPIVEAVIEIRGRAQSLWREDLVAEEVRSLAGDYPKAVSKNEFHHQLKFKPNDTVVESKAEDLGWRGFALQTTNDHQIVQFYRDSYVFSRLPPYEDWVRFRDEALRLWQIHLKMAQLAEVQRIGVRFINKFNLPAGDTKIQDYIQPHPVSPSGFKSPLPFVGFLHQDTLAIPGHPYAVTTIRTIQPPQNHGTEGFALIVDIDAFTVYPFTLTQDSLESKLEDLRWIKNKVFFGSVTEKALKMFQ
jgi:uncharacterized protein (TIGR04255 family)